jgi:hypothetical protein
MIFSPADQKGLQVIELPLDDVLQRITPEDNYVELHGYRVNLGAHRLQIFKANPSCSCCGIVATRAFIDKNVQQSREQGKDFFHINLYAESGDQKKNKTHLILMCKDHIIPRSKGGSDDNSNAQTLCFNCNCLKDTTEMTLSQMRRALFPAYRAFRSSYSLNKAKQLTRIYRQRIENDKHKIEQITKALSIVTDDRAEQMKAKIIGLQENVRSLTEQCDRVEREAQISGIVPQNLG